MNKYMLYLNSKRCIGCHLRGALQDEQEIALWPHLV